MKDIFKYSFIVLLAAGLFSCKGIVEDLNEDPNNPADAPYELMMTGLQLGNVQVHEGELTRLVGMWSGYFTGSDRQYIGLESYNVTAGDFDSPWQIVYANTLSQARIVQEKAAAANDKVALGIAQIIEAHTVGTAASLWGDIPYTQAADVEQFPEPVYDSQIEIYAALQTLLDKAIVNVAGGNSTMSDATFFTDTNWGEVANTLKARYYMHTKEYGKASTAAAMGLNTSGSAWMADHDVSGYTDGRFNLIFSFCIWNREGYMTAQDAHLPVMLDPTTSSYRGNSKTDETLRFGYFFNQWGWYGANYDPHWWAGGMFWRDEAYPLLTYNENQLILAETAMRDNDPANALIALNNVRDALDNRFGTGVDTTYAPYVMEDFMAGGMEYNGTDTNSSLMDEIFEEKYVSMYAQIEGYNDLRRLGNPVNVPVTAGAGIPERIVYPQSEVNANDNVPQPLPGILDKTPANM